MSIEDLANKELHPLYAEWERDDDSEEEDEGAYADYLYDSWRDEQLREEEK